jgi:hypothetical protein
LVCLFLGGFKKLKIIGMISIDNIKTKKIEMEARIPNSINIILLVKIKVAKPNAVVVLVKNIALPIF